MVTYCKWVLGGIVGGGVLAAFAFLSVGEVGALFLVLGPVVGIVGGAIQSCHEMHHAR